MNVPIEKLIRSLDVLIVRNHELEDQWSYQNYSVQISEEIQYYCNEASVSEYMKHQISKIMHQGYVVIDTNPFASPVRSIYETMERVIKHDVCRGILKNVSGKVGFEVLHCHFAQSSCIIENWVNHAGRNKLGKQGITAKSMYESLTSSLSKRKKTGEWIVYSKGKGIVRFWCVWLHDAGDEELIEVIRSQAHNKVLGRTPTSGSR